MSSSAVNPAPVPEAVKPSSRRERLRSELTEQIVEIGRRQLEEGGVANVNWRGIAKEVGMNPASLYTYVDGINDLYTRILGHSFRSLADAIADAADEASGADARTRLLACARAYRAWAVAKPNQFNLIFTNQIPGYVAPTEGDAFRAAMDVNAPFVEAIVDLLSGSIGSGLSGLSPEQQAIAYGLRSLMHGFTILEINQHSPYTEGSDDVMLGALSGMIDTLVATSSRAG